MGGFVRYVSYSVGVHDLTDSTMWQQVIVAMLVIGAAVYAARTLGPKRWRRVPTATAVGKGEAGQCGCGKGDGCH